MQNIYFVSCELNGERVETKHYLNEKEAMNAAKVLSKIFIRIEDCPEWTKETLYEMRKNQLEKELKQEKRLELKRKLFPFLKK